jgi:hypothetical protein
MGSSSGRGLGWLRLEPGSGLGSGSGSGPGLGPGPGPGASLNLSPAATQCYFSYDHMSFSGVVKCSSRGGSSSASSDPTCRFDRHHRGIDQPPMVGRCSTAQQPFLMTCVRGWGILSFSAIGRSARPGSEAMKPLLPGCSRPCSNPLARLIYRTGERTLGSSITGYSFRRTARRSRDNGWAASGGALKVERCLL